MTVPDAVGAELTDFLRRVRRRWCLTRFVHLAVGLSAGALAVAACLVAGVKSGLIAWPFQVAAVTLGVSVAGAVLVVSAIWAVAASPALAALARTADRKLGLRSLLASSWELTGSGTAPSLAGRALLEELRERLPEFEVSRVVGPRLVRWHGALPLAVALVVGAAGLPTPAVASDPGGGADAARPAEVAEDLRRLAHLLEAEPQGSAEQVAAVTNAMRELAARADRGELTVEELSAEVSAVLDAVARTAEGLDPTLSEVIADARARGSDAPAPGESEPEGPEPFRFDGVATPGTVDDGTVAQASEEPGREGGFDPASVFRTLGEVVTAAEEYAARVEGANAAGDEDAVSFDGTGTASGSYYTDWEEVMGEEFRARQAALRQRGRGEVAAGEAAQSDDAAGDAAGLGTQPLDQGAAEPPVDPLQVLGDPVALQAEERPDGRTVTLTPAPQAGEAGAAWDATRFASSLMASPERPTAVELFSAADASLIADYFSRGRTSAGRTGGE